MSGHVINSLSDFVLIVKEYREAEKAVEKYSWDNSLKSKETKLRNQVDKAIKFIDARHNDIGQGELGL